MHKHKVYVSEKVLTRILQIIERLQKAAPHKAVTKERVCAVINKQASTKPKLNYRTVGRAFQKLCAEKKIKQVGRSRYWLPEYLERNQEYQKKNIEYLKNIPTHLEKQMKSIKVDTQFEKEFWETVDNLRLRKIAELEQKLLAQERHYEDRFEQQERQEILEELRKKDLRASKKK